jgi:hypothetical protein
MENRTALEKLLQADPDAMRHFKAIQAYNTLRTTPLDAYLNACAFFFELDVRRGNQCPMSDVLLFTLADLYDQEPLPNFEPWEEKTSMVSLIQTIST